MPSYQQSRDFPYPPEQVFALVADIESYPQFVPGYRSAQVTLRSEHTLDVAQEVGLGPFRQRFESVAVLDPPRRISIHTRDGPFRRMATEWRFESTAGGSRVSLRSDWEFRAPGLGLLAGQWMHQFTRRIIAAFEARARALYGRAGQPE